MTLETPVRLWQVESEFEDLLALYAERKPARVLEIGVYEGGSLYHWISVGNRWNNTVVGVDLARRLPPEIEPETLIVGDSTAPETVLRVNALGPFDWVFIDGGHDEETVRADWANYGRPLVRSGGIVALHDIVHHPGRESEVERVWPALSDWYDGREIVADDEQGWAGIGVLAFEGVA